ncbi:unnamed protein product, partial [Mesorhabditis spiculigera]
MAAAAPEEPPQPVQRIIDLTKDIEGDKLDLKKFISNILRYIDEYTSDPPSFPTYKNTAAVLQVIHAAREVIVREPGVVAVKSPVAVCGPLMGHGDSLIQCFANVGRPCKMKYIFLGNYAGSGAHPHEVLLLMLALKALYPDRVIALKGHMEDPPVLEAIMFIEGMKMRDLVPLDNSPRPVWQAIKECVCMLPLAATINDTVLCVSGGIGPLLCKEGLQQLGPLQRPHNPSVPTDRLRVMEVIWGVMRLRHRPTRPNWPHFSPNDVEEFCNKHGIKFIVRGRQFVANGFLNNPRQLVTLSSAENYLALLENQSAVLIFGKDPLKVIARRWAPINREPDSLDDNKAPQGTNQLPTSPPDWPNAKKK